MKLSSTEASFTHGLRALLVDHNPSSLFHVSKMLQFCHYQVTQCQRPIEALTLTRNGQCKFDNVITVIDFSSDMRGLQFLEIIDRETDLPIFVVSEDNRKDTILECVRKGACDYILKPARMEQIQLLWQHVARKERSRFRQMKQIDSKMCRLEI